MPIVGADLGAFVAQLLDPTNYPGLKGAAVTNTAAVGGAGIGLALKLLNGETVTTDPSASQPNTVLLKPVVADNVTDAGKALLKSWQVDGLDPLWPLGLQIEGYTTYTPSRPSPARARASRPPRVCNRAGDAGSAGIPRVSTTSRNR